MSARNEQTNEVFLFIPPHPPQAVPLPLCAILQETFYNKVRKDSLHSRKGKATIEIKSPQGEGLENIACLQAATIEKGA